MFRNFSTGVAGVLKLNQIDLGQAEQLCTLSVPTYSCMYSTVQHPGAGRASVEVSLTLVKNL